MMYWFAAAAVLLVLEMFIGTFYLLVVCISLLGAGIAAARGAGWQGSLSVAGLLSVIGIFAVYRWRKQRPPRPQNNPSDLDIGHTVVLQEQQPDGIWQVHYRGTVWQARADFAGYPEQPARIAGKDGNILILKSLEE